MVYLRAKTVKGDQYLYLVKSVWDSKKATSRQELVKYLGKASHVTKDDIPSQYRNDKKISSIFSSYKTKFRDSEKLDTKYRKELLKVLQQGDLEKSFDVYSEYRKLDGTTKFFEKILRPVMYDVGDLWAKNEMSIGTEHVCSNTAKNLINNINQKNKISSKKQKIMICTPEGEEHCIGCSVLESYLSCKGFQVLNLAPAVPAHSVLTAIEDKKPDAVLVSITLKDNLKTGQRLVKKIKDQYDVIIVVGGQALLNNDLKFDAKITENNSLNLIPKLLRSN